MEPYKILMIDDSAELRRILHIALEDTAVYVVVETGTIAEGRALLADERPDLLILDAGCRTVPASTSARRYVWKVTFPFCFPAGLQPHANSVDYLGWLSI